MRGLSEGACTIKPGQKWLRELFKGAVFSRARSDQGNTVCPSNVGNIPLQCRSTALWACANTRI